MCVDEKQRAVALRCFPLYREAMSQRKELTALKNLISETDQILATTPELPENRTARCRELLRSALALADDLLSESKQSAATTLGRKGGSVIAKRGSDYFRKLAARRKTHGGGRPRKESE
jgi:hypothetical protein